VSLHSVGGVFDGLGLRATPQAPPRDGAEPRVRLARLAAAASAGAAGAASGRAPGSLVERWVPAPLTRGPGRTRRRYVVVGALVVFVVAVVVGSSLLRGSPAPESAPQLPVAADVPAVPPAAPSEPVKADGVVVSVVGRVAAPGVVSLPAGARVADALTAAGGAVADTDLSSLNLARRLTDGEQLHVGVPVPPGVLPPPLPAPGAGAGAAPVGGEPAGKINLNTATLDQLDTLPGVGEVTAKRIVDWRTRHGTFGAVEQLREVEGIGETRFSRLREQVVVW